MNLDTNQKFYLLLPYLPSNNFKEIEKSSKYTISLYNTYCFLICKPDAKVTQSLTSTLISFILWFWFGYKILLRVYLSFLLFGWLQEFVVVLGLLPLLPLFVVMLLVEWLVYRPSIHKHPFNFIFIFWYINWCGLFVVPTIRKGKYEIPVFLIYFLFTYLPLCNSYINDRFLFPCASERVNIVYKELYVWESRQQA